MDAVAEKVVQYKFPLTVATLFASLLIFLIYYAPSFLTVVSYFWPLLLSTAVFLVVVVLFGQTSPLSADFSGQGTGEEIMGYVAGQHQMD